MSKSKFITLILIILVNHLLGQVNVTGTIVDDDTGLPLEATNIQIENSYRGTISNSEGSFSVAVEHFPVSLYISYIGYSSQHIKIDRKPVSAIDVRLRPVMLEMEPIVVIAEDPAVGIMKEVINRKKIWREKLNTYKADAYTRLSLETDTSIAMITESISEAFWDKKRGPKEIIKSKRQTDNIAMIKDMFVGASYITNFYDDDVEIQGFKVITPTHPDALKHYNFKLLEKQYMDDKLVYKISVIPDSKLQPVMQGTVWVLDEDYALLQIDLTPSDNMIMPFPIQDYDLGYKQQFSNFGREFWLPVDVRISGSIKIGMVGLNIPRISYNQISHITDYQVNIPLPDSLYKEKSIFIKDSVSLARKGLFDSTRIVIPLSARETTAYQELDSTKTLDKQFKPTGFLARFSQMSISSGDNEATISDDEKKRTWGLGPQLWFNRVDGGHIGLTFDKQFGKQVAGNIIGGYSIDMQKYSLGSNWSFYLNKKRETRLNLFYKRSTDTQYNSAAYSMLITSFPAIFGDRDYFNYFWNERLKFSLHHEFENISTGISVSAGYENHSSLSKHSDYNIFNRNIRQRANPVVDEGELKSLKMDITIGEEIVPWGIVGTTGTSFSVEWAPDIFSNDFNFTRYEFAGSARINTFLKRRIFPMSLDLLVRTGTHSGTLPVQKMFSIDSRLSALAPFGTFKTINDHPLLGEKYFAGFWEYNLRTVPFELLGIEFLTRKGVEIILGGSAGRTWLSDKTLSGLSFNPGYYNQIYHEAGISINKIFNLIRLDYTWRLDKKDYFIGISFARLF